MGFGVLVVGFEVWGLGSGVRGLRFLVCGLRFEVWILGLGVEGLQFGVWWFHQGVGLRT